jgi:glyoxylase I family protein
MALDLRGVTPLIQVYDMTTSLRFYRDGLGFEVVYTSPQLGEDKYHWVMLRLGAVELMLNGAYEFDEERPVSPDPARVAAHDDATLYFACPDVDAAYAELCAKGAPAKEPALMRYGMKQMDVRDPDGFLLCFQWRIAGVEAAGTP